ncbi:hypothetical protein C9374_000735 [Naegleria lovaniensis]|uniref:Attractin/MKLN-like beta-propeller domain-containing protein n=1 Tax=Naegleria lovaniensis TaxID=51637 RepID=A0AA88GVU9_NAELO|nr:uncharacterized protein C9374_000735 [Naegleria lovaniensis]KAG2387885.1 hypothetical protein C9374_000735 [Naegleria lovaniensis]
MLSPSPLTRVIALILLIVVTTSGTMVIAQADKKNWERKANMITKRSDLSAQTIGNLIYLTGGCVSSQSIAKDSSCPSITNTMEIYNPTTKTFSSGPVMPRARYRHTTVAVAQRYMFVIGGRDLQDNIIQPVDIFDTVTSKWTTHPNASLTSECCSDSIAFVLKDTATGLDNIYLPGGYFANYSASNEVLILKTRNTNNEGTFQRGLVSNINTKRGDSMTLTYNNRGYVIGGFLEGDFCNPTGIVEMYDPSQNKWTTQKPLAHARGDGAAIMIDANLFVLGGETKDKSCNFSVPVADVEKFDLRTSSWSDFVSLPTVRFRQTGEIFGEVMYVFGGQIENSTAKEYTVLDWVYAFNFTNVTYARVSQANVATPFWWCVFTLLLCVMVSLLGF